MPLPPPSRIPEIDVDVDFCSVCLRHCRWWWRSGWQILTEASKYYAKNCLLREIHMFNLPRSCPFYSLVFFLHYRLLPPVCLRPMTHWPGLGFLCLETVVLNARLPCITGSVGVSKSGRWLALRPKNLVHVGISPRFCAFFSLIFVGPISRTIENIYPQVANFPPACVKCVNCWCFTALSAL